MSFLDKIGLQRTIDWVKGELSGKVDREPDKDLSTNDYSDVDKAKLNGIEAEATKNSAGTNTSISSTGEISATDTITTINGKTGAISKADIVALGIPSQDTVYEKPSSEPIAYIQGLQAELDSKVESYGTNPVLNIAVISAGGSTTGIPSNTLILELE